MIKVFTLNKNNKIELTKEELQKLLDEAYWDGRSHSSTWTYTTPSWNYRDYITCSTSTTNSTGIQVTPSDLNEVVVKTTEEK